MKRKLSLLMVVMMMLTLVPMSAFAAESTQLKSDASDAIGFVGETEVEVTINASELGITFEVGSTISFDGKDEIVKESNDIDVVPAGTSVSGNVATITNPSIGNYVFEVELGEETGTRQLTIRAANGRVVRRYYAEVLTSGASDAELLQSKVKFTRAEQKSVASFILRSPGEGTVTLMLPKDFNWVKEVKDEDGTVIRKTDIIGNGVSDIKGWGTEELTFKVDSSNKGSNFVINPVIKADRNAAFGDVDVAIDSEDISRDLVIAEYVDYNVVVKVDKERELLAGDNVDVKVTLDGVAGAFTNRDIKFMIDGGEVSVSKNPTNMVPGTLELVDVEDGRTDELYFRATNTASKVEVTLNVKADLDATAGEVTLTVVGGGVDEQTVTLVTVNPIASFETKVQDIRVTNVATKTADIVITETEAGALPVSTTAHVIAFRGTNAPVIVDAEIEIDGNMDAEVEVKDGQILLTINRASRREGSVITIKNVEVTVPRATLPGKYDLRLSAQGTAKVAQWTYVNVLEPGAIVRKTTVFTLDSAVYTVDGEQMMLDAAPYISNNRTMLPIGTMAQLLGATVNYSPATRTAVFSRDNLVVSMNLDTNVLLVNGVPVMMDAKPEIQNDRAFVPVVFVAQAFGVQNGVDIVYDAATRTVTLFPNN